MTLAVTVVIDQHASARICHEDSALMTSFATVLTRCGVYCNWFSSVFDEDDHGDIVENTANLTNVDVSR